MAWPSWSLRALFPPKQQHALYLQEADLTEYLSAEHDDRGHHTTITATNVTVAPAGGLTFLGGPSFELETLPNQPARLTLADIEQFRVQTAAPQQPPFTADLGWITDGGPLQIVGPGLRLHGGLDGPNDWTITSNTTGGAQSPPANALTIGDPGNPTLGAVRVLNLYRGATAASPSPAPDYTLAPDFQGPSGPLLVDLGLPGGASNHGRLNRLYVNALDATGDLHAAGSVSAALDQAAAPHIGV
jgi:hypothetical protein